MKIAYAWNVLKSKFKNIKTHVEIVENNDLRNKKRFKEKQQNKLK